MALNFPNSPGIGSVYTDTVSGFSYEWDGTVWKSYSAASSSQIKILDDISGSFNGIGKTFAITSNSVSLTPANAQSLIVNLGGVVQDPTDDYSVVGTNIKFSDAPTSGLTFSGVSLGPAVPITTILDGTTTQGSLNVVGVLSAANLIVSGITTLGVASATNLTTQQLNVTGLSTFAGITTVTGSTLFVRQLSSSGIVTASSFVGNVTGNVTGNLTGTASTASFATTSFGLSGTPNVTVGVITATEFDISGSTNTLSAGGLNVGVATATTLRVGTAVTISAGVVTATSFVGSGANLTGLPAGYTDLDNALFG